LVSFGIPARLEHQHLLGHERVQGEQHLHDSNILQLYRDLSLSAILDADDESRQSRHRELPWQCDTTLSQDFLYHLEYRISI
jgi:hypothetical protein